MVVIERFYKITLREFDVIEFCEIKNMRFRKHGRGNIQLVANLRKILEKMRVGQLFGVFVYVLFADSALRH